jgi:BioD-like phosphotransacetylase family protein
VTVLYIAGSGIKPGKTSVASTLISYLSQNKEKVNGIKPFTFSNKTSDPDITYYSKINSNTNFSYEPIVISKNSEITDEMITQTAKKVETSSQKADFTIIEGIDDINQNLSNIKSSKQLINILDAKIILIINGTEGIDSKLVEKAIDIYGIHLKIILVNRTPKYLFTKLKSNVSKDNKINELQNLYDFSIEIVPEDRKMIAPSVNEIGAFLKAEFPINDHLPELEAKLETPVEYLMVGGWSLDSGNYIFSKRNNKAVIIKGDRPDLQMAALESSTSCLILTNGQKPIQYVIEHAIKKQIPILSVNESTQNVMRCINAFPWEETSITKAKSSRFENLLNLHFQGSTLVEILDN